MLRMTTAVERLALAFTFTGQEQYSTRAATLLRVWFLDPATRMNPHLTWAQANPGHNEITGTGIINSVSLVQMPDAITLLSASRSLSPEDHRGLKAWFGEYLDWLLTSQKGKLEAATSNNHGVWYDAQVATYAVFVGRPEVARRVAEAAKTSRVTAQIEPDGRQPLELRRTRSLHYTLFNLRAFFALARAGKRVGVDLWGYSTSDGRSIRKALDYLAQYAAPDKKWPARELNGYTLDDFYPVMLLGAVAFQDPALLQKARQIARARQQTSPLHLLLNE
jgi:hypothetical protein